MAKRTKKQKLGDCYEAAFNFFMDRAMHGQASRYRLVHGEVGGQGPLEGIRYGHAWVVDVERGVAIDKSNGRSIELPVEGYEALARVDGNKYEYEWDEVRWYILQLRHYGPWDLVTSSGL